MDREIPFNEDGICEICGKKGTFDFFGDEICPECASEMMEGEDDK